MGDTPPFDALENITNWAKELGFLGGQFEIAKTFLNAGFNVICDKPMTVTLAQAKNLKRIVEKTGKVFLLTHNYTGYPMVKQARHLIKKGALGNIN